MTHTLRKASSAFSRMLLLLVCILSLSFFARAQTPQPTPAADEPAFIVPARPTVSNPAEFQRPGVLQLELGYDANFHSRGNFTDQQDVPLALRFALSRRVLIELDTDSPFTVRDTPGMRNTGLGDTQLGVQFVLHHENPSSPGAAFAYYIKLPTASDTKGLGTGRVDNTFLALVSKTINKTT